MSYQSSESLHKDPEATQFHSELHTLINAFGDAVISVDRDGRFVLWNPGAERLFGYTSTEALGESLDLIIPPQSRKAHWEGFYKAMRLNQTRLGSDLIHVPMLRKDQTQFPGALTVGVVRDENKRIVNIGAIIREDTIRQYDQ
ncbi:PAS domain-containing protein [Gimesia sp.]|uniref:PAS domain-containing protein n=1 Tax=Gimesia sp. TaxID=2024833 RepID=UPI0032ED9FF2